MPKAELPLFADGWHLSQQELLACQALAKAIPDKQTRANATFAGHRSSKIKGRGMEFAEVRHYQNGDDIRTIDWRVTARTGKTHTKLFVEERERPIIVMLDLSNSLYFGSQLLLQAVQAAHLATTLGWHAISHGDRIGALIACESEHIELKPKARQTGILQLIASIIKVHDRQLAEFQSGLTDPQHIYRACQRLVRLAKPGSLVWLITDGAHFNQACLGPLMDIKRHCDMGAFIITDPLRQGSLALPSNFNLPVRDGQVERILNRQQYQQWLTLQGSQQDAFISMMNKLQVNTRLIDAGQALSQQLDLLRS